MLQFLKFQSHHWKFFNPYKLSNHFVVAGDCVLGIIVTTENERYVEFRNTGSIPDSSIKDIHYTEPQCGRVLRHQAFILPDDNRIDGISDYYNQIVRTENIPHCIIKSLESYGVFI